MGLKKSAAGVIAAVAFGLAACATPVEPALMTPKVAAGACGRANPALSQAIGIAQVAGGRETNPTNGPEVGNDALREALRQALAQCGLLSADPAAAPYRLKVTLVELNKPLVGFIMTADAFVRYELVRAADGAVLFDEIINGTDTRTVNDAFMAGARLKIASGGAVRATIAKFLSALSTMRLPGGAA